MHEFAARTQIVHHCTHDRKSSIKVCADEGAAFKTSSAFLKHTVVNRQL